MFNCFVRLLTPGSDCPNVSPRSTRLSIRPTVIPPRPKKSCVEQLVMWATDLITQEWLHMGKKVSNTESLCIIKRNMSDPYPGLPHYPLSSSLLLVDYSCWKKIELQEMRGLSKSERISYQTSIVMYVIPWSLLMWSIQKGIVVKIFM